MSARHVIFASYGNDSVALIQWAHEAGIDDVAVVYSDTGWAAKFWPDRVARAEKWARNYGFATDRTSSIGLPALVRERKGWPRQGMQFCTLELKINPALRWLHEHDPLGSAICLVGVRSAESRERQSFPRWSISPNHGDRIRWAPLIRHTDAERDALLARAGFDPLPHRSRECWPCVNANRTDLRGLANDPERVDVISALETELGFTSKGKPRTMYRPYQHMGATGIHQILRWAASRRGKFNPDDGTGGGQCEMEFCER